MSRDGSIAGLAGSWGEGRAGSHAYDGIQTEEQEQVLRRRVHDSPDFHLLSVAAGTFRRPGVVVSSLVRRGRMARGLWTGFVDEGRSGGACLADVLLTAVVA